MEGETLVGEDFLEGKGRKGRGKGTYCLNWGIVGPFGVGAYVVLPLRVAVFEYVVLLGRVVYFTSNVICINHHQKVHGDGGL